VTLKQASVQSLVLVLGTGVRFYHFLEIIISWVCLHRRILVLLPWKQIQVIQVRTVQFAPCMSHLRS